MAHRSSCAFCRPRKPKIKYRTDPSQGQLFYTIVIGDNKLVAHSIAKRAKIMIILGMILR
ncbi:hypothetical protein GALMADRAFT_1274758 [Galerina marginata CBS 339.88]|uniref:Uncharacterized protein n=1 Tax=Galerina marginata (strain CBS 339.88) TaxID=685588 RepID=A0A067T6W4_GALM3|nr:hypothetical protein GALMADRAFT_1274758 [Galerina marginata CBS 339.88]